MDNLAINNSKIISQDMLINKLSQSRHRKTIISTNGCFDILHPGHIKFLENAKSLGDVLIVALNSDSSVKANKGNSRPLIPQNLRAYSLASLLYTDFVVIFEEPTPISLIRLIKPDIHVKGEEYSSLGIPEEKVIHELGGKLVYLPLLKGFSTSSLIKRIKSPK